jgi:hypothetical protein
MLFSAPRVLLSIVLAQGHSRRPLVAHSTHEPVFQT